MRYLSVCSGIEAASVAWTPLGWSPVAFSEIEPFPCAVLAHHYPATPNLGDMTTISQRILNGEVEAPDVLAGGTPCQSFSVAGLRKSLADERGNLTLKFVEIADAIDSVRVRDGRPPAIVVWENVPGVLSTKDNAFGCFLGALAGEDCEIKPPGKRWTDAGCVFGPQRAIAWRVLDAQYFGLAQRRRRVFVVASARKDFDPTAILFEFEGVRRDTPPRREAGQSIAPAVTAGAPNGGPAHGARSGSAKEGLIVPITMSHGQGGAEIGFDRVPTLTCNHEAPIAAYGIRTANTSSNGWGIQEECTHTLDCAQGVAVAHAIQAGALRVNPLSGSDGIGVQADHAYTLEARAEVKAVQHAMLVRRLTPTEAERLQGFPDGYTAILWRGKPADQCPDGPRYKALGNSWAVPVVRWIGERINAAVELASK